MRRFRSLVAALPKDSATARSLNPERAAWPDELELTAQAVDAIWALNANFVRANTPKGHHVPAAPRVPRPHDEERDEGGRRRMATKEEMRAFFGPGAVRYTPKPDDATDRAN